MPNINLQEVYETIEKDYEQGLEERKGARKTGIAALKEAISLFDASYGKGAEKTALADYEQSAVSRGLAGSTRGAAVSTGMKHQFEDVRRGRLGDALAQLAQFLSSFQSGAPTAGNLGYIATGGFGAQSALEQQRFEQEQASFQGVSSRVGSVGGGGAGGSLGGSPYPFRSSGSASGSVADSGSTWGDIPTAISQQQPRKAPTFAGMEANYGLMGETSLGPEIPWGMTTPDWAEEAAAEQEYQGGWTG